MKKRKYSGLVIIVAMLLLIGGTVGVVGQYYQNRYKGSDYFVKTPVNLDIQLEDIEDSNGKVVDTGKNYRFIGYNEKGEQKELEWTVTTSDPDKLIQPGTYWRVSASKQLVVGQEQISKEDVPQSVRALID